MTSTEMANPGTGAAGPTGSSSLPEAWRIEVFRREGVDDPEGVHARAALLELGLEGIESVLEILTRGQSRIEADDSIGISHHEGP